MLAFDIVQFFPSLNYQILPLILLKADFDSKVLVFFQNYLIRRKQVISGTIFPYQFSILTWM